MSGIKKYIASEHPKYFAKGGIVDPENPDSYLTMSVDDPLLFDGLTDEQKLSVFGNYAPTLEADTERLQTLQNNFLKTYKGTPQYYVPKQGFVAKKDYDIYASSIAKPKATPTEVKSAVASSVFKPKYPAVNTPEWDENQVRIKEEQERRKNEKVQYKATGGVVDSTLEEDAVYRGGKSKKQSTKGSDVAKDIALGTIDLGISTFAPDLIKEKDYSSRYGAHINKTTHGVSQVANSVAEGILHAIFPATAALSPAKKQLGTAISGGKDEAISEKQLKQEGAIAQVGNMGGSLIGSAIGEKNKKETDNTTKTPSAVTQVATAPVARTYQKQDATTYNPDTFDINSLDDADKQGYLNIQGNEAKINYLRSIGYYSKGGEIVGKGTGTSDSIDGTLDGKGFVVPAENADKAVALRAKYFGNADKKANLKGGDEKVKVSDGEHYFTPEERTILEANGEDLDALAPDANGGQKSYKCGGGVKKLAKGGSVGKDDPIEKAMAQIKIKQEQLKKEKEKEDLEAKRNKFSDEVSSNREKRAKAKDEAFDKMMNYYNKRLSSLGDLKVLNSGKFPKDFQNRQGLTKEEINDISKAQERVISDIKKTEQDFLKSKKEYDFVSDKNNYDAVTHQLKSTPSKTVAKTEPKKSSVVEKAVKEAVASVEEPKATTTNVTSPSKNGIAKSTTTENNRVVATTDEPKSKKWLDSVYGKGNTETMKMRGMDGYDNKEKSIVDVTKSIENPTATTTTKEKGKGILGNIDAEKAIALGQTGIGIQQLLQDGPRPVDSIDSDFSASVAEAKKDANFGLSPLERSIADQNIERSRRGGIRQIIALAGGNSGAAMSNIAAVNIANADNINNLAQTSERLMMDKKRYRDNLIGMKAGMARQLFQDKLNAFEQDQMAGANLVQSGIRNYIGSLRYDKQVQADAELEANRKKSTQVITG